MDNIAVTRASWMYMLCNKLMICWRRQHAEPPFKQIVTDGVYLSGGVRNGDATMQYVIWNGKMSIVELFCECFEYFHINRNFDCRFSWHWINGYCDFDETSKRESHRKRVNEWVSIQWLAVEAQWTKVFREKFDSSQHTVECKWIDGKRENFPFIYYRPSIVLVY